MIVAGEILPGGLRAGDVITQPMLPPGAAASFTGEWRVTAVERGSITIAPPRPPNVAAARNRHERRQAAAEVRRAWRKRHRELTQESSAEAAEGLPRQAAAGED